ncbi:unnamed protein product [Blepharisma stoltei]|uniref:Palmitoyltransferase n=1 Tax=Blepharisma stoltei TaxID=1481888 RepID=A0AAU9JHU3_9CILI|nr:unnamed protein product [Blepharisma stoltei]
MMKKLQGKAYLQWPGNNRIILNGRILLGSNLKRSVFTFLMLTIPEIFFISYPGLHYLSLGKPFILIISLILSLLSLIFFIFTAITTPGYLPKQIPPFATGPKNAPLLSRVIQIESINIRKNIRLKNLVIPHKGVLMELKYCPICYILRPPRAAHCEECGHCVEDFDHHCPWVSNCIGKRNYKFFYIFLSSLFGYIVFIEWISIEYVCKTWFENDASVIMLCVIFIGLGASWFVIGLWVIHSYLIAHNLTTREKVKQIWEKLRINPFDKGLRNIARIFERSVQERFDLRDDGSLELNRFTNCHKDKAVKTVISKQRYSIYPENKLEEHIELMKEFPASLITTTRSGPATSRDE